VTPIAFGTCDGSKGATASSDRVGSALFFRTAFPDSTLQENHPAAASETPDS
jgi:hypothetical protein